MLTAFVQEGHYHVDTLSVGNSDGDNALQILVVIVGGHIVSMTAYSVSQAVVQYIGNDIQVGTTYRLQQGSFTLTGKTSSTDSNLSFKSTK